MSDLASQLSKQLQAKSAELAAHRQLIGDVYTALLAAGWCEDELIARVRAAREGRPDFARNLFPAGVVSAVATKGQS